MKLYLAALLLLALCALCAGLGAVFFSLAPRRRLNRWANSFGSLGAAGACALGFLGAAAGPWQPQGAVEILRFAWALPFGSPALALDALSRLFLLPVFGMGFACAMSGAASLRHEKASEHNLAAHWFFYALLLLGMAVVACARDAILFLLAWEIMSLAPFFLIDFNDRDSSVRDASWVYLTAAHLGAVLLIAFFAALWQATGQTGLWPELTGPALAKARPGAITGLFLLALGGFGAKAGLAPMHVWLPDAHPAAPSHISALLSAAMINLGLYGVIRTLSLLCPPGTNAPEWWGWLLLLAGLGTAFLGIVKALGQDNLKRLLAYSSVENMGLMFMGLGLGLLGAAAEMPRVSLLGFAGCLLHMLNHAGFKGLLFLCAGEILHATGTLRMELLGGLQQRLPLLGALFALGAASIACLPPFSGFTGEFSFCLGLASGAAAPGIELRLGLLLALGLLALISGVACAVYVKAYGIIFLGRPRSAFTAHAASPPPGALWPLLLPATACVAGGLLAPVFFAICACPALESCPLGEPLLAQCLLARDALLPVFTAIALCGWALLALAFILWCARRLLLAGRLVRRRETWSCGYQGVTDRIQYTEGSFSQPLARIFAPILGLRLSGRPVEGIFPGAASLDSAADDRIKAHLYTPLFEGVEKICNACKILQHGKIHIYILYILATVVGLLLWGLAQ